MHVFCICFEREKSESNHTPKFLTDSAGRSGFPRISIGRCELNLFLWPTKSCTYFIQLVLQCQTSWYSFSKIILRKPVKTKVFKLWCQWKHNNPLTTSFLLEVCDNIPWVVIQHGSRDNAIQIWDTKIVKFVPANIT